MSLSIKVFTSSDQNDGFGVTSTIIMGEKDAILVDAQFTISNAHRLLADIIETKKELKKIFITHLHPDHFLGLEVIKKAYPEAEIISYKDVAADINEAYDFKIDYWGKTVLNTNGAKTRFSIKEIDDDTLYLDGCEIKILGLMSGDCIRVTPLWIPSIKTIIASDIVFSDAHVWVADMRTPERMEKWMQSLDKLESLGAEVIVPGHSPQPPSLSPSAINFTRNYIKDFITVLHSVSDSKALEKEMDKLYPNLPVRICLEYSARILKDNYIWPGDWPVSLREMKTTL
jgi:glyoxylase-like metal-dependent hydrolase (beta-lactamase superfamily II)